MTAGAGADRDELRRLADAYRSREWLSKDDDEMVYRMAAALPAVLDRLDAAEADRDRLAGQIAAVRELCEAFLSMRGTPLEILAESGVVAPTILAALAAPTGEEP